MIFGDIKFSSTICIKENNIWYIGVAIAVILGICVRLPYIVFDSFPTGDGGLFALMIEEVRENRFFLPMFTSFNRDQIPFAYPPFALYLGAFLGLLGFHPIELLQWVPFIFSTAAIPATFALARVLTKSDVASLSATFVAALLPRSFVWTIMGGGLTRAPGYLFALLTILSAWHLYTRGRLRDVVWTIVGASLVVLTHPTAILFTVVTITLLWICYGRNLRTIYLSIAVLFGTLVATFPWWFTIFLRFGFKPILFAREPSTISLEWALISFPFFRFTDENLGLVGVLAVIGLLVLMVKRQFFVPLWLLVILCVDYRGVISTSTVVPLSILAGTALSSVIFPGCSTFLPARIPGQLSPLVKAVGGIFLMYGVLSAVTYPINNYAYAYRLSPQLRDAMVWVRESTPDASRFVVVSHTRFGQDAIVDWFPYLAQRHNVTTFQGYEWVGQFSSRFRLWESLMPCATKDALCFMQWADKNQVVYDYVMVMKDGGSRLAESMSRNDQYRLVFDNSDAAIFYLQR